MSINVQALTTTASEPRSPVRSRVWHGRQAATICALLLGFLAVLTVDASAATARVAVPAARAVPGFRGKRLSGDAARRSFPRAVGRAMRRRPAAAMRYTRGRRGARETLAVVAWNARSHATAAQALRRARRAARRLHPRSIEVADGAFSATGPTLRRRHWSLVALRQRSTLAIVSYAGPALDALVDAFVLDWARSEAALLRRPAAATPWTRMLERVGRRGGQPTPGEALTALARIGARIPGVRPSRAGGAFIASGTMFIEWALSVRDSISTAQRRAVDRFLNRVPPSSPTAAPARRWTARARASQNGIATTQAEYQRIADRMLKEIEKHLGPLGFPVEVRKSPTRATDEKDVRYLAHTEVLRKLGPVTSYVVPGDPLACHITVFPDRDEGPSWDQDATLGHEIGHCYQLKYVGRLAQAFTPQPPWLLEGLPSWIGATVARIPSPPPLTLHSWQAVLMDWDDDLVTDPLMERSYDAMGFFGMAADVIGEDALWARVPEIVRVRGSHIPGFGWEALREGLIATAGARYSDVLDRWGPSLAGRPDWGSRWTRNSPAAGLSLPSPRLRGPHSTALLGAPGVVLHAPFAHGHVYVLRGAPAQLVRMWSYGTPLYGWVRDADGGETRATAYGLFCTSSDPDACHCPNGSEGQIPPRRPLPLPADVGLSGGESRASDLRLTLEPYDKYCKRRQGTPDGDHTPGPESPPDHHNKKGKHCKAWKDSDGHRHKTCT